METDNIVLQPGEQLKKGLVTTSPGAGEAASSTPDYSQSPGTSLQSAGANPYGDAGGVATAAGWNPSMGPNPISQYTPGSNPMYESMMRENGYTPNAPPTDILKGYFNSRATANTSVKDMTSINGGVSGGDPAHPATQQGNTTQADASSTGGQQQQQQTPPPAQNVPLPLYQKSPMEQARLFDGWMRTMGVDPGKYTVGGSSPYDSQINATIDKVNNPNTTTAEKHQLAMELQGLLKLRTNTVTGTGLFSYTGEDAYGAGNQHIDLPPGARGTNTLEDLISRMHNPGSGDYGSGGGSNNYGAPGDGGGGTSGSVGGGSGTGNFGGSGLSGANSNFMNKILAEFSGGGDSAEQRRVAEARLVDQSEQGAHAKKEALVNRLGALGIQGGAAADQITQLDRQTAGDRTNALGDLQQAIMAQQNNNKSTALSAFLHQQDQGQNESQFGRQLGQNDRQFGAQLGQNQQQAQIGAGLTLRGQDQQYLMHLLDLASAGDDNAKTRAIQMMQQLGVGGE